GRGVRSGPPGDPGRDDPGSRGRPAADRIARGIIGRPMPTPARSALPVLEAPSRLAAAAVRDPRPGLSGVAIADLEAFVAGAAEPGYRTRQVLDGVWRSLASSPAELRTLPAGLRARL